MPPLGRVQAKPGSPAKAAADRVAAAAEPLAHAGHLGELAGQRHGGRVLDERRQAVEHAQRQVGHVARELGRADQPADAPAGHGVRLGQAGDGDGALGHAGQGGRGHVLALVEQRGVDLVGDQPEVVAPAQLGHGLELGPGHHRPGRVVGRS